ncbi:unnamed protein product [Hyaloperonospora brassicae]|uniref:Kazal-like domain-containing protein n=1 Tax=Hyaloperonospora brassicae TaxID=162125 RepID=A0AAV0SYF8_HYABA|nr:unnamed protein product [Hyaloperonospora brassicae]
MKLSVGLLLAAVALANVSAGTQDSNVPMPPPNSDLNPHPVEENYAPTANMPATKHDSGSTIFYLPKSNPTPLDPKQLEGLGPMVPFNGKEGKDFFLRRNGIWVDGATSSECPTSCSDETGNTVCGSDGITYGNECWLRLTQCLYPKRNVWKASDGDCQSNLEYPKQE